MAARNVGGRLQNILSITDNWMYRDHRYFKPIYFMLTEIIEYIL